MSNKSDGSKGLLNPSTMRNLGDKLYEKRKLGALEIEELVKEGCEQGNAEKIDNVIDFLAKNFAYSSSSNQRKGGLIALAAAAIGLGSEAPNHMSKLAPPVLKCFTDPDSRVRYYACESMYNIAKVTRGKSLTYFNDIFDGLCRLSADPDLNVQNGAELLDRLIKDIVTESDAFDIEKFIPLLQERIKVVNGFVRTFLLSWITVLDSVPDIDLLDYLPEFLDGLLRMLSDKQKEIRNNTAAVLGEFLRQVKQTPHMIEYGRIVEILIPFCSHKDEFTQSSALNWINELIVCGQEELLPYTAQLVCGVLPCISNEVTSIQDQAAKANISCLRLVNETDKDFPISDLLSTVTMQFLNQYVPTRLAALRWVLMLHSKMPDKLISFLDTLYPALLKTLSDPAEDVVRLDLEVLALLSTDQTYFDKLMNNLIHLFSTDQQLLEMRGSLIIRQLSVHIDPEKIFRSLAHILVHEEDPDFASLMTQTLNLILLTTTELHPLRTTLRDLSTPKAQEFFEILYMAWCHNAVSTISLCFLSRAYEHATALLWKFSELEITVQFLVEIDKLVQLLESPIFTHLRLQLLEPHRYPHLVKALYAILMLLPQGKAFALLNNRLNCVANVGMLHLTPPLSSEDETSASTSIPFDKLTEHFVRVQERKQAHRRKVERDKRMATKLMRLNSSQNEDQGSVESPRGDTRLSRGATRGGHSEGSSVEVRSPRRGHTTDDGSSSKTTPSTPSRSHSSAESIARISSLFARGT